MRRQYYKPSAEDFASPKSSAIVWNAGEPISFLLLLTVLKQRVEGNL